MIQIPLHEALFLLLLRRLFLAQKLRVRAIGVSQHLLTRPAIAARPAAAFSRWLRQSRDAVAGSHAPRFFSAHSSSLSRLVD